MIETKLPILSMSISEKTLRCATVAAHWALLLLLAGCVSPRRPGEAVRPPAGAEEKGPAPIHGQYADPSVGSFPLYEVYLVNTGLTPRVFTGVSLDGRSLLRPTTAILDAPSVSLDGFSYTLPVANPDPDIVWWQFYPSAETAPGASVVLRICFRGDVRTPRSLVLNDASGGGETVKIPRRTPRCVPLLTAVAYAADLSRIDVLCDSLGNPPATLWVNGNRAASPRLLTGSDPRLVLVEAATPVPLHAGMPIDLCVRFADGRERRALLRILSGISVYNAPAKEADSSHPAPVSARSQMIPVDGVCSDLRSRRPGGSAWHVIRERERLLNTYPDSLAGFGFCTGVTPDTAAIYGRMADAVFSKPYRHGWGRSARHFLDEEVNTIAEQRAACAPFPFLYIPERFERKGRSLSPTELETLEWTALASGAKGLRRHFAYNPNPPAPDVADALRITAADVTRLQPILAPLVPVSDETQGDGKSGYVRVLTAWSGSQGVLFFVRDRSVGAFPVEPPIRRGVRVKLDMPAWCHGTRASDLLSGETFDIGQSARGELMLPELKAFRVLWVESDPARSVFRNLQR